MTVWQVIGGLLVAAVFAFIFGGLVRAAGWRYAVGMFGTALALAAVLILGVLLVKGKLP